MLGLGETREEIRTAMRDLRDAGVDALTLGQYLRPTEHHLSVVEYVTPQVFEELKREGEDIFGFQYVASGPMVRSSYKAGEFYLASLVHKTQAEQDVNQDDQTANANATEL